MATKKIIGGNSNKSILAQMPWDKVLDAGTYDKYCNIRVFPELMQLFNKITLKRNEEGLISATNTLEEIRRMVEAEELRFNCGTIVSYFTMGKIFQLIKCPKRADLLAKSQTVDSRFATNVPLFMSAFKELRNVQYSKWDLEDPGLKILVDSECYSLIEYSGSTINWTNEKLIQLGIDMRTFSKGSKRAGEVDSIKSYRTNNTGDEDFDSLPKHVRRLITQIWAFEPSIASEYAIRNLTDIDAPAEPLITTELFEKPKKKEKVNESIEW